MIWGAGTGVFNLTYSSGLPTDSIIISPDKSAIFSSIYYKTTFLASSVTSPSSEKFPPSCFPSFPLSDCFYWTPPLLPLSLTHLLRPPPLPPLPLKALSWSLTDRLHFYALDFLAFTSVLSGIETSHCCLTFYFLEVMFLEQLVWSNCLDREGSFIQRGAEIMTLHVQEWAK